jgi:phenylalanine-4-hydroxylase
LRLSAGKMKTSQPRRPKHSVCKKIRHLQNPTPVYARWRSCACRTFLRSSAKLGMKNNVVREMTPLQIEQFLDFLTTFCVFPLTGFLHPTILRFQIRGTW